MGIADEKTVVANIIVSYLASFSNAAIIDFFIAKKNMIKLFFLLISLIVSADSNGQPTPISGKPRLLTKKEIESDRINQNCFYKKIYTSSQRRQFYPFNKAAEIRLISFNDPDSAIIGGQLAIENGQVDATTLREIITINSAQIDSLTDLLFNIQYGGKFYSTWETMCYNPRNAILFIDSAGNIFDYIELCFECEDHRLSSRDIKAGDFCNQKYEYLKNFFAANGIRLGVNLKTTEEQ